ncbi:MAG: hypothetical protein J5772_09035 [Clostridia bacterium]|nr:hypothetical protein [Clostridia bacterium]
MKAFTKALILLILAASLLAAGCGRGKDPASLSTPAPENTGASPTDLPEYMQTPDPALYELGDDGYFEDEILCANWPSFLEYIGHVLSNNAQYRGYLPNGKKLLFSYLTDDGASYSDEIAGHDKSSYQKFMREQINEYFELYEFEYTTVDGHQALRVLYDYAPPDDEAKRVHVLQYLINVRGWVMTLTFTTQDEFPEVCDDCIKTIRFKDGY